MKRKNVGGCLDLSRGIKGQMEAGGDRSGRDQMGDREWWEKVWGKLKLGEIWSTFRNPSAVETSCSI